METPPLYVCLCVYMFVCLYVCVCAYLSACTRTPYLWIKSFFSSVFYYLYEIPVSVMEFTLVHFSQATTHFVEYVPIYFLSYHNLVLLTVLMYVLMYVCVCVYICMYVCVCVCELGDPNVCCHGVYNT